MRKPVVLSLLLAALTLFIPAGAAAADADLLAICVYKQQGTCDTLVLPCEAADGDEVTEFGDVKELESTEEAEEYQVQVEDWCDASFCVKDEGDCKLEVSQCGGLKTHEWSAGPFLDEEQAAISAFQLRLECYKRKPEGSSAPVPLSPEWWDSTVPIAVGAVIDRLAEGAIAQVEALTAPPPTSIQAGSEQVQGELPAGLTEFLEAQRSTTGASLARNAADLGLLEKLREVATFDPRPSPWSTFSTTQLFDFRYRLHFAAIELQALGVSRSDSAWAASEQVLDDIESELARRGRGYRSSTVSAQEQQRRFEAILQLNAVARREALHLIDGSMLVVDDREEVARLTETVRSIDLAAGISESELPAARDLLTTETGRFRIATLERGVEDLAAKANLLYGVCTSCDIHLRAVRQALGFEIESLQSRRLSVAMKVTPTRGPPESRMDSFYTELDRKKMKIDHDEAIRVVRQRQREIFGLVFPEPPTEAPRAPRPPPSPKSPRTADEERMANLAESYFRSLAQDPVEGIVAEAAYHAIVEVRGRAGANGSPTPAEFLATDPGVIDDLLWELGRSQRSVERELERLGAAAPSSLERRARNLDDAIAGLREARQQAEQRVWGPSEVVRGWIEFSESGPLDQEASLAKVRSFRRALERAAEKWGPLAPASLAVRIEQATEFETSYKLARTSRLDPILARLEISDPESTVSARELDSLRSPEALEVRQVVTAGRDFSTVDELGFVARRQPRVFGLPQQSERSASLQAAGEPGGIWLTPDGLPLVTVETTSGYEVEGGEPCLPKHRLFSEWFVTRCVPIAPPNTTHTWMEDLRPW